MQINYNVTSSQQMNITIIYITNHTLILTEKCDVAGSICNIIIFVLGFKNNQSRA